MKAVSTSEKTVSKLSKLVREISKTEKPTSDWTSAPITLFVTKVAGRMCKLPWQFSPHNNRQDSLGTLQTRAE